MSPTRLSAWPQRLAALVLGLLVSCAASAQDAPDDRTDAEVLARSGEIMPPGFALGATRSSPFDPPEADDRTFVVDTSPGLDTGCTFRNSGPLVFDVEITRHVGPVNADGTLQDPAALVSAGVLSATALLTMPGFDVDSRASVSSGAPEVDRVLVNGTLVGTLDGLNNVWILNGFRIPIELLRFPAQAALGSTPTPTQNQIVIEIDVDNTEERWCTAVDWASVEIKAASPVVLVHGNNSDGGFFDRQGFVGPLRAAALLVDGCGTCPNPINMVTSPVATNATRLLTLIPQVVGTFGTDSYHLVVHSKGGLDSRMYLAAQGGRPPQAVSYTSLSSPHNGSVGADVLVQRQAAAARADRIEFASFPGGTDLLTRVSGVDAGTPNLTTTWTAGFNTRNLPALPRQTLYNAVGGDLDINGNGAVSLTPDEYLELRQESSSLANLHSLSTTLSRNAVDVVYQVLRNVSGVTVTYRTEPGFLGFGTRTVATLTAAPTPTPLGNDGLVTIPSALGVGTIGARLTNRASFTGAAGRNHSSIANAGVARTVLPWILNAERVRGDLR